MSSVARALVRLLLLTVVSAGVLRVADAIPRALTGLPRGVIAVSSVADAQRRGLVLPVPSVYPEHLEWPPWRLTATRGGHVSATVRHRVLHVPWLVLASAPETEPVVSPAVLPPYPVLQDVDVDDRPGPPLRVQRLGDARGIVWHQATWVSAGRRMVLRYRGPLGDLLAMANTLRARSHP